MRVVVTQLGSRRASGASSIAEGHRLLRRFNGDVGPEDVVLLPELIGGEATSDAYDAEVQSLAAELGAWVVGGSHFARDQTGWTNSGVVADPWGRVVARYGKLNPYGGERSRGTKPGGGPVSVTIGGISCLVMICADFWHSTAFPAAGPTPDLILVPAFSASQRPQPEMARARWRHAMVARAYEFSAFIAVSDWAHPVQFDGRASSGVAGFAHPNPVRPQDLHQNLGRRRVASFDVDVSSAAELRVNRAQRGFDLSRRDRTS